MILAVCPNPSIDCYAWLPALKPREVNRMAKLREYPGGKGVHVALAVKALDENVGLFGCWAGNTGEWIRKTCRDSNIHVSGVTVKGSNRKCYTIRSRDPELSNTEILEPGPKITVEGWRNFKIAFEKELKNADIISFSGSWPENAPEDAYHQLMLLCRTHHKKVFLDCSGSQLAHALRSPFFGLHLNEKEALTLCGSTEIGCLLKKLNNMVELVALTKGEKGLIMSYKGKIYEANVAVDRVVSTVGSGDCLTAGIVWALHQRMTPKAIASYGVACGAANCLNEALGMLKKEDVLELLPKVTCKITTNDH